MLQFFFHGFRSIFHGSRAYWLWVSALLILALLGLNAYARQLAHGLITSGMGDEVSGKPEFIDPRQYRLIAVDFF